MILVDVYVPSVGQTYNFSLNEQASIQSLLDEITEMIAQKEQTVMNGDAVQLMLWDKLTGSRLEPSGTLSQYGIKGGADLILV